MAGSAAEEAAVRAITEAAWGVPPEQFRRILDSIPAAVYTTDAEGRLTHFNQAAIEFSGRVPNLGTDQWCVSWKLYTSTGEPLAHDQCPMAVALKEARAVRGVEAIAERPDGSRVAFMPYPTPLRDEQGRVVGGVNMLVDITARRTAELELERRSRHLAAFLDTAAIGLHRVGADGTILWANEAEMAMLGYSREEYVGQPIARFHADAEVIRDILAALGRGEKLHDREARLRCKDGSTRTVLIDSSVLWENGEFVHTQCFTRDVTELREAERRKDEFIATLSHELRNPLAPIMSTVALLGRAGHDAGVRARCQAILERQVRHLSRLLDDLMDVNRISHGAIMLEQRNVDAAEMVNTAAETCQPQLAHAAHKLAVELPDLPVIVHADPVRLNQLLTNLLNNAAKFTPSGGRITLSVRAMNGCAEFTVRDNGVGIAADQLERVFERLSQTPQRALNGASGLGIGLSISRQLARLHGGDIVARSDGPGRGSEFTVRIPLAPAGAEGLAR